MQHTATTGGTSHEASCCDNPNPAVVIELNTALYPGNHILAIIGVNQSIDSSDFHLIAELAFIDVQTPTNTPVLANYGTYSLTKSSAVTLNGSNTLTASTHVSVNGDLAGFNSRNGQWSHSLDLEPGANRFYIAAHDATGTILTNADLLIVREQSAMEAGGAISGNVIWNDPSQIVRLTNNLVVPGGASLEIGSGVVVILPPETSITATTNGVVRVRGTDGNRALFLPSGEDWGWLRAQGTNALLDIQFGEIVAGQVRVHTGGILRIEDSIIRDYPDTGIEVIEAVNGRELTMRRTYMTRFAEGDASQTPVLVEGCLLEGFLVDGLDIKATTAPLIVRRSTFRNADPNNSNADAIDFGPGAGRVESCLIHDFPDKGVSIGGAPGSYITNTVIYRCGIGISAYASTNLVFEDTTITDCINGILFRDNPARAVGWGTNLIIWGNQTNIAIQNTSILNLEFSDVEGNIYPGTGNISADPLFVDAANDDFRLLSNSPARGTGVNGTDIGAEYPVGGIPARPEKLVANKVGTNQVQLSWIDASANEGGLIQKSPDGIFWELAGNSARNSTSFTDATSNLNSYYRVRAINDMGVSEFSNRAKSQTFGVLSLQIERSEGNQLVLTFPAEAGVSYILETREDLTSGTWETHSTVPAAASSEPIRVLINAERTSRYFRLVQD